ncbi:MAG: sigma-54-dependent Fis family transcriptional regulator [Kofleriaceae bacterium]|nr:sigma-54-dependent Fis family transcriptional regulator [Kofleriaceae bacterium]MBP9167025.1 sigma-54-dependent Fis family transcriptional regulator [Kofleriaceae bacterium]MBP9858336.1 sigma-54-dependent Fis family transcriptional regulator [Kofleriaceae bacterium]
MTTPTVLLVDDEPGVLFTLREVLTDRGLGVVTAASGAAALPLLDDVAVVVTDLQMPGMTGLELCAAVTARDPTIPVILLTAYGSDKVAVAAVAAGAYDYLTKPFDIDHVAVVIGRALEAHALRLANRRAAIEAAVGRRIVAESRSMRRLLDATARVATRDVTVLVRGETGTGKEFIAQLLHAQSRRAARPLVRFNCAALPADLAEAELFGHVRGAFTGAVANRRGFFAEADGGTLVLDEIGELPLPIQAKLLRALQEGEIQPVGSGRIERVDVRVVAATHRDLTAAARAGTFREDLYYRLAVVELVVPPLRERADDIPALAQAFARHYGDKFGLPPLVLEPALVAALVAAPWPGNVRQLENAIARLAALAKGEVLRLADFREHSGAAPPPAVATTGATDDDEPVWAEGPSLREQVEAFERGVIARALTATGGNQSEAARRLGTSRVTLLDKIKKYGLATRRGEST